MRAVYENDLCNRVSEVACFIARNKIFIFVALFSAAGIQFDFSEKTLRPLISAVEDELEELPR